MNVIKMKDILGNQVIVERTEMFAALFKDDCDLPAKYFYVSYHSLVQDFIKNTEAIKEKARAEYSCAMDEITL